MAQPINGGADEDKSLKEEREMMKKKSHLISLLFVTLLLAVLGACEVRRSNNGDLDGFWHLEQIDTLATGGSLDLREELRFWSFQVHLMQVADYQTGGQFVMYFDHSDGKLRAYDMRYDNRESADPILEDVSLVAPFGINSLHETFNVESLSGSRMVLSTDSLRLHLRKF